MKVECAKEKIRIAVASAERITGKNLSLPILAAIVIESTDSGRVFLSSTNLDMGIEIDVPARVGRSGKIAVLGSVMNNFLANIAGDDAVSLEEVVGNLSAQSGRHIAIIKSVSCEDFPAIPRFAIESSFSLASDLFRDGVRSVSYAASVSDIKPEISSVYVYTIGGEVVFAATDSFRLAEKRFRVSGVEDGLSFLIPHKNALEAVRALDAVFGEVHVGFDKNQVAFLADGFYFTSRRVGGVFPDYTQIIPKEKKTEAVVSKRDLIGALKLTSVFSDKFNRVTMRVVPMENLFEIESRNTDRGENTTRIDATLEGEPVELSFNSRYVLDAFQSIPEDSITLSFNGSGKPLVMHGAGGPDFTYLVMPLNN